MRYLIISIMICSTVLFSCKKEIPKKNYTVLTSGMHTIKFTDKLDDTKKQKIIPVDIYIPKTKKIAGDILVLPGWRFSRSRWHMETQILKECDAFGYRAIFPDMKITVYESQYFPEGTIRWSPTPGRIWIEKILIPELQNTYGIFLEGNKNYLLGLSTGARGVMLIALHNSELFTAGAVLSGDFDQTLMQKDRLMRATYGPYNSFKKRWQSVDNPVTLLKKSQFEMPLYIGHGKKDRVIPIEQSKVLYNAIKEVDDDIQVVLHCPDDAGHDFKYWGSEVKPIFNFFKNLD